MILQLGRKFTKQDTLDLCIRLAKEKFEDLIIFASDVPRLTPEIVKRILKKRKESANSYYNPDEKFYSQNDKDAYSI